MNGDFTQKDQQCVHISGLLSYSGKFLVPQVELEGYMNNVSTC